MQGIGNALFEEMRLRATGMPAERRPARVPRALRIADLPGEIELHHRRERRRSGALRGEGLRRGRVRRHHRRPSPPRVADAGVPDERAAAHAGARLAAHPGNWRTRKALVTEQFRTVAIMGTGTMGPGMGAVLARAGIETRAVRHEHRGSSSGRRRVYDLAWGVLDRLETPDGRAARCATRPMSPRPSTGVDVVIEAVPEKLELKKQVFAEYEQHVGPESILASNTSGIPITKIAADLRAPRAGRGHALVEPAPPHPDDRGRPRREDRAGDRRRRPSRVDRGRRLLPVLLKKEVPGFVENRVLYAIMRECLALVDAGVVDLEELDLNVKWGIGYKLAVIPPDAAARHGRAGHLHRRRELPQPGPLERAEVSLDDPRLIGAGPPGHEDEGRHLRLHATSEIAELRAQRCAGLVKVRKVRQGARAARRGAMKIYLLDLGSLVIDRSDVLWHIDVGHARALPGVRRLHRPPRGQVHLRHRLRPRPRQKRPAVRAARADARPDAPGAARRVRLRRRARSTTLVNSHFHFDHVGGNKHLAGTGAATSFTRARSPGAGPSRSSGSATRT